MIMMFIHIKKVNKQKITNIFASITLPFVFSATTLLCKLSGSTAVYSMCPIFEEYFKIIFQLCLIFCFGLFYCIIMEETLSFIISFQT